MPGSGTVLPMIGRTTAQRLFTVAVVVGLVAMTLGIGAAAAETNESEAVVQTVDTGEDVEDVTVENESTQTIEETETESETSFATSGPDASDDDGDVVDFGDDFIGDDFATDIVDQTFANVGELFE